MRYLEIRPRPPINQFIECFWTLEGDSSLEPGLPERILPDGCAELILNFAERFCEHQEDGSQQLQPLHFFVGQMTRPILITPTGAVQLVGVRFHPGGTLPFFRNPMHELTNQVVQLGQLGGTFEKELMAHAADEPLLSGKLAAVEKWFRQRIHDCKQDSWLLPLTARIVRLGGQLSVDELASAAGVSGRQLERRFLRDVGLGPKQLCRILRFQQVLRVVEQENAGWSAVAVDCGYYDQAHLIRDFKEFARQTPALLFSQPDFLTESFSRKKREVAFFQYSGLS